MGPSTAKLGLDPAIARRQLGVARRSVCGCIIDTDRALIRCYKNVHAIIVHLKPFFRLLKYRVIFSGARVSTRDSLVWV
jgi:hypothetical protein